MSPSNRTRSGLTLIEVLVVVAILAVLAAIALPAYQAARARAKVTRSVNNLKQISLALRLYAETHGQNSPLGLGLPPHGPSTLVDLKMIPVDLLRTRGTDLTGPGTNSDAYVWFPPTLPQEEDSPSLDRWQEFVEHTNGNPVLMLDKTQNTLTEIHDPFHPKLCIVLWADGSVQTTRRTGVVGQYGMWKRRE